MIKLGKRSRSVVTLFLCSVFILSCGSPPSSNRVQSNRIEPRTTGVRGGSISYRLVAAPKTFNYLLVADEPSLITAFFLLTGRLVEFDHTTQKFTPGLAESWTSTDGINYDITLREGLKFSDGDPLTADDVVFTLDGLYDDRTKSPAFRDAMTIDGKPIAFRKIDDRRLQFTFPKVVASAENYLTNVGVLPSHKLEAGKLADAWKTDAPPETIVTSGPFIVASVAPGERVELARNPHYWKKDSAGTQLPYLDKLTLEVIADANNTFVRLSQGTLDVADRIRPNDFAELAKTAGTMRAVDVGPALGVDHLWFNLNTADPQGKPLSNDAKRAWFADKRFRQAIAAAIDRQTIASITLQGLASPLYGFISPANRVWLDPNLPKIDYDLKRAEQMLADAGFKKGGTAESPVLSDAAGNAVEFTLIVPAENEPRKLTAAVVQEDLAKLGIKLQVVPLETAKLTERWQATYDYDAVLFGLSPTDLEPSSYGNFLLSSAPTHQWQPKQKTPATEWEARIDQLFAEQSRERDQARRRELIGEIQRIMREEMPVVPLIARHVASAGHSRVGNYTPSSIVPYSLWNAEELFVR